MNVCVNVSYSEGGFLSSFRLVNFSLDTLKLCCWVYIFFPFLNTQFICIKGWEIVFLFFSYSKLGEGNGNPLQYSCQEIPWTEEPSRLQSMGSQRVRHDWAGVSETKVLGEPPETTAPWKSKLKLSSSNELMIFHFND